MKLQNLDKQTILDAIEKIENSPELRNGRESILYDLEFNGNKYPPILVISEANKLLGGSEVTLEDFGNSTNKAFHVLQQFGFNIIKKNNLETTHDNLSTYNDALYNDLVDAGIHINRDLSVRFLASVITKPFVILTGLSGSGKTQLALAFTKWICSEKFESITRKVFDLGEEIKSNRVTYKVTNGDKISVTFTQIETSTKANFPYELIYEWIDAIKENNFTRETSPRTIRDIVESKTKYSPQLNSFETHLKAAAFYLIDKKSIKTINNSQVCIVPVGADWTNREPLLGFPNALKNGEYIKPDNGVLDLIIDAGKNPQLPYFIILDEMNLSHVERYFADFLSVMESKEKISIHSGPDNWNDVPKNIYLPENLFVIGTVNIDETTYMFSPKVLDRANVIEFRISYTDMQSYFRKEKKFDLQRIKGKGSNGISDFLALANKKQLIPKQVDDYTMPLLNFFQELRKTGAEYGYRSAAEILRFAAIINRLDPSWSSEKIIDAAIMQKLLPKVHGSRRKLEPILKTLGLLCLQNGQKLDDFILPKSNIDFTDDSKIKYPISFDKILRMYDNLISNGFTSYAEA